VLQARDVAELRLASAELQLVSTASARLLEVVRALTELAYAAEELAIRERSLERTLVQLDIADAELAAGRIAEIELDLLRQRAAANQEAVLVSWANAETRTREVQRLLGESTQLSEAWRVLPPDPTLDWSSSEALCELAAERSPEVASLEANVDVARADLVRTRDGLRPQLDVTASLSQNGLADNLGDSYLQVVRFDATTVVGGVVFTMPLGNHVARDAQAQAEVALEQATFEVDQARLSLCQQVQELAAQQTLLGDRLSLAQFRVDIAQRGLDAEQARFAQGLSTVQTGLQALEDLETAETERLRIDVDARLAAWQAWHLTGQLAETFLAPLAIDGGVSP
jgi:outer membrane protein TolC